MPLLSSHNSLSLDPLQFLFPGSYAATTDWLKRVLEPAESELLRCQQVLLGRLEQHQRFKELADSCMVSIAAAARLCVRNSLVALVTSFLHLCCKPGLPFLLVPGLPDASTHKVRV